MTALFSKPKVDTKAQEAQIAAQRRQEERVREQELEENLETGSRNRILGARLSSRGAPNLLNQQSSTLGG